MDMWCSNDGTKVTVPANQPPPVRCPTCGQGSWCSTPTKAVGAAAGGKFHGPNHA